MNNGEAEAALNEIAELLELKGESVFRIRAYQNAAKTVGGMTEDINKVAAEGRLKNIKGIGEGIAAKIDDLLQTGSTSYLEDLRAQFPEGVRSLMAVPGVGPSLARRAYKELGVQNLEELREAAQDGRLSTLPGLGEKSAENILRGLERTSKRDSRISIGTALPLAEEFMQVLEPYDFVHDLLPAGSLRRWKPTIGDIDLMATSSQPARVMEIFVKQPRVRQILGQGLTKSSIVTDAGLQIDLRILEAQYFGALLQHFTGSKDHNIQLRDFALRRGLSLNEYGITEVKTGKSTSYSDEISFYRALGLDFIPPELREGAGEITAAATGALPNLVTLEDVRGDLHVHSNWSDGSVPIETMIEAALEKGYEYMALTDHSGGIGVAHGLDPGRLLEQLQRVDELRKTYPGIHILTGTELEIKRDGKLDFPDELLEKLDWVIASVHSGFNQSEADMTARIIRAIENPHVDAIGHPTGMLIGARAPYAVDLEAVFKAAARTRTALEINASPQRLDLVDVHARRAKDLGAMLVIDTDAHAPRHLDFMRYGVAMARRGWAEPQNVLNSWPFEELCAWIRRDAP